jgi:hypothetical protein
MTPEPGLEMDTLWGIGKQVSPYQGQRKEIREWATQKTGMT